MSLDGGFEELDEFFFALANAAMRSDCAANFASSLTQFGHFGWSAIMTRCYSCQTRQPHV